MLLNLSQTLWEQICLNKSEIVLIIIIQIQTNAEKLKWLLKSSNETKKKLYHAVSSNKKKKSYYILLNY